jgi:hypothetical protein
MQRRRGVLGQSARAILALGCAVALAASPVPAQSDKPPVSFGRALGQVGLGTLGLPLGFVAGGVTGDWIAARLNLSDDTADKVAIVGAWTGAALATAGGSTLVGSRGSTTGSYGAAIAGAAVGGIGSYLLIRLNERAADETDEPCRIRCIVSAIGVVLLPSIGATVGYNLSREFEEPE